MTDIVTPDLGDDWDLGELLQERVQPTGVVRFYLAENESAQKDVVVKRLAKETDEAKVAELEKDLAELDKAIESKRYIIHLTAVPSRMREDIASKALSQFPLKRDVWGHDEQGQALARMKFENNLIWFAQVTGVEKNGRVKKIETPDQMQAFADSLPTAVQKRVDETIRELTTAAEKFTIDSADQAF